MKYAAILLNGIICAAAYPAADVPQQWQPVAVERECEDFNRGTVRPDPGIYGPEGWAIMNAEEYPNAAEYDFESPGGWSQLLVRYAARDSRPVTLSIDGVEQGEICSETTGSWAAETARWFSCALVYLEAGEHVLRLERNAPFPHLDAWALAPVGVTIEKQLHPDGTWSLDVAGEGDTVVSHLQIGDRRMPLDARLIPGTHVWLVLERPETKAGPLMLPNLTVGSRLRRAREWVDTALEYAPGLGERIGADRADDVLERLGDAQRDLADCSNRLQTLAASRQVRVADLQELLADVRETEEAARGDVYIACGSAGAAHAGLRKTGYHTLVGNQLVATAWTSELDAETGRPQGPREYVPGLASLSFYPPRKVTFFSVSRPVGMVEFHRDGERLETIRDEHADDWRPHRLHTQYYIQGGGHISQDMCVDGNVAVARLSITGLPEDATAQVVGEALAGEALGEPETADGAVSLAFHSAGADLAQAVAVDGVGEWDAIEGRYSATVDAGGDTVLTIAATIDPDAAAARERVSQALTAGDAFHHAEQRWASFFSEVLPRLSCPDARLMDLFYMTGYVLWADRYDMPDDGIWDHPYVVPSKWTWRGIWPEDLAHALTGLRWFNDPETAYGCLRVIRDHFFNPDADKRAKVHAYGLLTMAAWQVFERFGDVAFIEEMYPTLAEMHAFIANKTDEDGDGLPSMWDSFKLGWDSSKRFDYDDNLVDGRHFRDPLEAIDCAVYHWRQSVRLAQMAQVLGDAERQRVFEAAADTTFAAMNQHSWDPETGLYYDVFADDERFSNVKNCAGIFPLLGGQLPADREEALIAHLTDPQEFWGTYPVPCVAMDEPQFGRAWSGAACLRNNWLIYRGLLDSGRDSLAGELAGRTFSLLYQIPLDEVNTGYYFDPQTGKPASSELGNLFSTPLGGVLDMIMTGVCGLRPSHDGDWAMQPLDSLQPQWWVVDNVTLGRDTLCLRGGQGLQPEEK